MDAARPLQAAGREAAYVGPDEPVKSRRPWECNGLDVRIGIGMMWILALAFFTLAETKMLAKRDLARRLALGEGELKVLASAPRTWPDASLGCVGRKGLEEPRLVPGYEVVLGHEQKRYTYRADRHGRLRRCDATGKPLSRIGR